MKRFIHRITILSFLILITSCAKNLAEIEQDYNDQKYEAAIESLNRHLFFNITDTKAIHIRARCYEELGNLIESKADYERIILIDDQYAPAYLGLGKLLFDQKEYENAELRLLKAATLDPSNFDINYLLGRTQLMTEQFRSSERWFRKAAEIKPEFAQTYFYTGVSLAYQGDALGAAASFNSYIKYEPDHVVGRYNRGFALMNAGYLNWAIEDFDAVLAKEPNHIEALAHKAVCEINMGNSEGCTMLQNAADKGSQYAKDQIRICI